LAKSSLASPRSSARADARIRERLIVALDVETVSAAAQAVRGLGDAVSFYKVGKQLFVHGGPDVVRTVQDGGAEVFLDLKFHDIPNTVAAAGVEAARLGVRIFNIHASGGLAMMERTVAEVDRVCRAERLRRPSIIAVTVLTSLEDADLAQVGVARRAAAQVVRLARLAKRAGLNGVVASPREIGAIRRACGPEFLIVTPGVRPVGADQNDQKRVRTPGEAVAAGADYLVVGRPILGAPDPVAAADAIVLDMTRGARGSRGRN
jgi:orotidine-5'-phosphate decarboxylase